MLSPGFPCVWQQYWVDVSVRCPHADWYHDSANKPGIAAIAGEGATVWREAVRPLVYESYGRLGLAGIKLLRGPRDGSSGE